MNADLFENTVKESPRRKVHQFTCSLNNPSARNLYTTDQKDTERFLSAIKRDGLEIPSPIWEPCAGLGDISKVLLRHGYKVISTDAYPYQDNDIKINKLDFFSCAHAPDGVKTIFTNPPFNVQNKLLEHALSLEKYIVLFVRLSFLTSKSRLDIYKKNPPLYVYAYSLRAHCYKDGIISKGSMIDYCLVIFKPHHTGETVLRWIE
jgi:hypothetical protein